MTSFLSMSPNTGHLAFQPPLRTGVPPSIASFSEFILDVHSFGLYDMITMIKNK